MKPPTLRESLAHFLEAGAALTRAAIQEVKAAVPSPPVYSAEPSEPSDCEHDFAKNNHCRFCPWCGEEISQAAVAEEDA